MWLLLLTAICVSPRGSFSLNNTKRFETYENASDSYAYSMSHKDFIDVDGDPCTVTDMNITEQEIQVAPAKAQSVDDSKDNGEKEEPKAIDTTEDVENIPHE